MRLEIIDGKVYKKLTEVKANIITQSKIIKLEDTKDEIDLHFYLIRRSQSKKKNVVVLELT